MKLAQDLLQSRRLALSLSCALAMIGSNCHRTTFRRNVLELASAFWNTSRYAFDRLLHMVAMQRPNWETKLFIVQARYDETPLLARVAVGGEDGHGNFSSAAAKVLQSEFRP